MATCFKKNNTNLQIVSVDHLTGALLRKIYGKQEYLKILPQMVITHDFCYGFIAISKSQFFLPC